MKKTKNLTLSAVVIAIAILFPFVVHLFGNTAGKIILPMHLPIIIGACFLPWTYALIIGALSPILSSLLTGMPILFPMAILMMFELSAYAVTMSLLVNKFKPEKLISVYPILIAAQLIGRVVLGIVVFLLSSLFTTFNASPLQFVIGGITTGLIGIVLQLIIVPPAYFILMKNTSFGNKESLS